MRSTRLGLITAAAAAMVLAVSGCGSNTSSSSSVTPTSSDTAATSAAPATALKVLWVQPMDQHPVHKIMQAGFLAECKTLNMTCDIVGNPSATNYDVPASVALAEAAMAKTKYDVVAIYGPDPSINSFMTKVAGEGYPVVTWHVLPPQGSIQGLKAATGQDIPVAGANAAKAMGDKLGGKGTVAVTEGSFNASEDALAKAFTDALAKDYPGIKVLAPQVEGFDPVAAQAKAVSILQGNPDVVAAFSTTGAGAATWAGAQRTSGRKLTIIGVDYVRQNLDLVKKGEVYGLVAQPLYTESQKVADLASKLGTGATVDYLNLLPAPIVLQADLDTYYKILTAAGV